MPYVKQDADGVERWYVGDRNFGSMGGNVIRADNNKLLGRLAFPKLEQAHPGGHLIKERLQAMDDMGVYAQIGFQNSGVTQAGSLMSLGDPDLALAIVQMYNDASAEYQHVSGNRIFNMGHLPFWDQKALETEARRCFDMGIKGFVLPDTPERVGVPSFMHDYWTPFLETMFSIGNAATLGNWMVSGRLDRHPKLKIGLIESGMGWLPFAIEALEHQFNEMLPSKADMLHKRPWEYFRDHFWVTFWFEKVGPKLLLETIGIDKVMFETDFPHPTSLYPGVQAHVIDVLGGYDFEVKKKVLQTNATGLYNLPF